MAKVEYIKDLYENDDKSLRAIAKETGHHFNTVKKYASQTDFNQEVKSEAKPGRFQAVADYIPTIDKWLEQDEKEPRKQRHTTNKVVMFASTQLQALPIHS